jgi:hypothetical protein
MKFKVSSLIPIFVVSYLPLVGHTEDGYKSDKYIDQMVKILRSSQLNNLNKDHKMGSVTGINYLFSTELGDRYVVKIEDIDSICLVYADADDTTHEVNQIGVKECKASEKFLFTPVH